MDRRRRTPWLVVLAYTPRKSTWQRAVLVWWVVVIAGLWLARKALNTEQHAFPHGADRILAIRAKRRPPAAEEIVHTTRLPQYNYGMRQAEPLSPVGPKPRSSLRTVDQVPHSLINGFLRMSRHAVQSDSNSNQVHAIQVITSRSKCFAGVDPVPSADWRRLCAGKLMANSTNNNH
jgi:hypothetical protein